MMASPGSWTSRSPGWAELATTRAVHQEQQDASVADLVDSEDEFIGNSKLWWAEDLARVLRAYGRTIPVRVDPVLLLSACTGCFAEAAVLKD